MNVKTHKILIVIENRRFSRILYNFFKWLGWAVRVLPETRSKRSMRNKKNPDLMILNVDKDAKGLQKRLQEIQKELPGIRIICSIKRESKLWKIMVRENPKAFFTEHDDLLRIYKVLRGLLQGKNDKSLKNQRIS